MWLAGAIIGCRLQPLVFNSARAKNQDRVFCFLVYTSVVRGTGFIYEGTHAMERERLLGVSDDGVSRDDIGMMPRCICYICSVSPADPSA